MAATGSISEIAGRYAKALFELAEGAKALDAVAGDLRQLDAMLDASDDLVRLVRSPVVSREEQASVMTVLLDKMKANDLTRNFIGLVANNRRLFVLRATIEAYLTKLADSRGEVTAFVTSATVLDASQIEALELALQKSVEGKITVQHTTDPSLIGGLIVKIGSRMVDASISTKLQKLKLAMKGV